MNKKTIKLNNTTLAIIKDIIEYNKAQFIEAEKRDAFKDNGYLIDACDKFKKACDKTERDEQSDDEKLLNALYKKLHADATSDKVKSDLNGVVFFYQCGRFNALQVLYRFCLIANGLNFTSDYNNDIVLNILASKNDDDDDDE